MLERAFSRSHLCLVKRVACAPRQADCWGGGLCEDVEGESSNVLGPESSGRASLWSLDPLIPQCAQNQELRLLLSCRTGACQWNILSTSMDLAWDKSPAQRSGRLACETLQITRQEGPLRWPSCFEHPSGRCRNHFEQPSWELGIGGSLKFKLPWAFGPVATQRGKQACIVLVTIEGAPNQ